MKAVVVYESHWGNTAAVAEAIAEGLGPDARTLTTDEADAPAIAHAEMIVAGSPVIAFGLPSERALAGLKSGNAGGPPADVSHRSLRSWLEELPFGSTPAAAFETRIRWSPGGATGAIEKRFVTAGYRPITKGQKFIVTGQHGPLREGELERARQWGRELAQLAGTTTAIRA
jgi:flavodoxin